MQAGSYKAEDCVAQWLLQDVLAFKLSQIACPTLQTLPVNMEA